LLNKRFNLKFTFVIHCLNTDMRALFLLSLVIPCVYACEVGPGCRLIPAGCSTADKICCTVGWNDICSCCLTTTDSSSTLGSDTTEHESIPNVVTTAIPTLEPTTDVTDVQSTSSEPTETSVKTESTSISVATGYGSSIAVDTTGVLVTVTTPQSTTLVSTPSAIVEQASKWLIPVISVSILLLTITVCCLICLSASVQSRVLAMIRRRFGCLSESTPTSTNLIDLAPIPITPSIAAQQIYQSVSRVERWNAENPIFTIANSNTSDVSWNDWSENWSERGTDGSDVIYDARATAESRV